MKCKYCVGVCVCVCMSVYASLKCMLSNTAWILMELAQILAKKLSEQWTWCKGNAVHAYTNVYAAFNPPHCTSENLLETIQGQLVPPTTHTQFNNACILRN